MNRKRVLMLWLPALVLFHLGCGRPGGPAQGQGTRIVILGLDGADWQLIDPLIAKGRLPLFKELKENAPGGTCAPARRPAARSSGPASPPAKPGRSTASTISAPKRPNAQGKFSILNSLDIREPMLWDMLGANGRRSVLVNWYLSFPPQPLNGVNVSDYFRSSAISTRPRERSI